MYKVENVGFDNYEISKIVTIKDVDDNDVSIYQPIGQYSLFMLESELRSLQSQIDETNNLINIIKNA